MNGSYSIIRTGLDNLEQLIPIYQDFLRYYHARYGKLLRDIPLTGDEVDRYLLFQFVHFQAVGFLAKVAVISPIVVGFTLLNRYSTLDDPRQTWQIKDLYISSAHRGKGLATKLLHTAIQYCQSEEAAELILFTGKINHEARSLYQKCDFVLDKLYFHPQNVKYVLNLA